MISMSAVADKAGVSRATVSYILNNSRLAEKISPDTRQRVLETAQEMGYHRNEIARSIKRGKTRSLGLLVNYLQAEQVVRMLDGAIQEAARHGYLIKILRLTDNGTDCQTVLRCFEQRLAGIMALYVCGEVLENLNAEAKRTETPLVHLDSSDPASQGLHIMSDDAQGFDLAVEHLTSLGHHRIGFLNGRLIGAPRYKMFLQAMTKRGLDVPAQYVSQTDVSRHEIEKATHALLDLPQPPTAILAATDLWALIAASTAQNRGLRVPHDLSVMGYGDLLPGVYFNPALTTIRQPFPDMGEVAVRRLIQADFHFENNAIELLPTRLEHRDSTTHPKS